MLRSLSLSRLLRHVRGGGRVHSARHGGKRLAGGNTSGERAGGGRRESENLILASQPENVQTECRGYLGLLKYWGDLTPHGKASGVGEAEAYTALMLLLRFAQFANDRWDELTKRNG